MRLGPLLAIESSCDETAAAILAHDGSILSSVVHSQIADHAPYGGVVPEIASREHLARIGSVVDTALKQANIASKDLVAVGATYGPGLIGALLVGLMFAKGMSQALRIPLVGVHHIEGHLRAAGVDPAAPKPPFVGLVASGGHTAIYRYDGVGKARTLGETRDDAAGEAFDKTAKLLGLGYPGGLVIDQLAEKGDPQKYAFPISLRTQGNLDFSFSGLKTSVRLKIEALQQERLQEKQTRHLDEQTVADICASLRAAIVEPLVKKSIWACRKEHLDTLVLGGGVAANSLLRREIVARAAEYDIKVYVPPKALCTDNAVMIAAAAQAYLAEGLISEDHLPAAASLPIEQAKRAVVARQNGSLV